MLTGPAEAVVATVALWILVLIVAAPFAAIFGAGLTWLAGTLAPMGGWWTGVILLTVALAVATAASADWPSLVFGFGRSPIHVSTLGCLAPAAVGCAVAVLVVRYRATTGHDRAC